MLDPTHSTAPQPGADALANPDTNSADDARMHERWQASITALQLFCVDPVGLGGLHVRGHHGPVRTRFVDLMETWLDGATLPVPAHVTTDRLTGGLDLAATLAQGHLVREPGLLERAGGRVLVLNGFERLERAALSLILQSFDLMHADGAGAAAGPPQAALVALDEEIDMDADAAQRVHPSAFADRVAFWIDLDGIALATLGSAGFADAGDIIREGRARVARMVLPDQVLAECCQLAAAFGVKGLRAPFLTALAARASAAMRGLDEIDDAAVETACALVLLPRATRIPERAPDDADPPPPEDEAEPEEADPPPPPEDEADPPEPPPDRVDSDVRAIEDRLIETAQAVLPNDLLIRMAAEMARASAAGRSGRTGRAITSGRRGRQYGAKVGMPGDGRRLNVIETLRAAAPWQRIRAAEGTGATGRLHVRKGDLRVYRQKDRAETLAVFVVDASGSSAVQRLGEAKGAIELMLAQSYSRRDHVALVALKGHRAQVLLPATRSLARAKRTLAHLPGGGGTPLASGIDLARDIALRAERQGQSPMVVVLTDGQANIARDGTPGRAQAGDDAHAAARALRLEMVPTVLIDTAARPQSRARTLAEAMGARYVPLPRAQAAAVADVVSGLADDLAEGR